MNEQKFNKLVKKLEKYAKKHPLAYKFQVAFLAIFGHLFMLAIFALCLYLLLSIFSLIFRPELASFISNYRGTRVVFVLILFLSVTTLTIGKAFLELLLFKFPPPKGVYVRRSETPELFSLVGSLIVKLKSLKLHRIVITDEFTASVMQIPSMGLFGKSRNYLIIGLPLLYSVSPVELQAILAHELGHLSGDHGVFQGWIYRSRRTWLSVLNNLQNRQEKNHNSFLFAFFYWYVPLFNAYSFVLARQNEYEADNCAKEIVGSQQIASALINVQVKSYYLKIIWNKISEKITQQSTPPVNIFADFQLFLKHQFNINRDAWILENILNQQTDAIDTHPCLTERLNNLNIKVDKIPTFLSPKKLTAAEKYLGESLDALTQEVSDNWYKATQYDWKFTYEKNRRLIEQNLVDFMNRSQHKNLSLTEKWLKAQFIFYGDNQQQVLPLIKEVLAEDPEHGGANGLMAMALLNNNDEKGLDYVDQCLSFEPFLAIQVCEVASDFLECHGQPEQGKRYREKIIELKQLILFDQLQRINITTEDQLKPCQRSGVEIEAFSQQFKAFARIDRVYLVEKAMDYFSSPPMYILGVKVRSLDEKGVKTIDDINNKNLLTALNKKISLLGASCFVMFDDENENAIGKSIIETAPTPIYINNR